MHDALQAPPLSILTDHPGQPFYAPLPVNTPYCLPHLHCVVIWSHCVRFEGGTLTRSFGRAALFSDVPSSYCHLFIVHLFIVFACIKGKNDTELWQVCIDCACMYLNNLGRFSTQGETSSAKKQRTQQPYHNNDNLYTQRNALSLCV